MHIGLREQTTGNGIQTLLQRKSTDILNCRAQAYDGTKGMRSETCGGACLQEKATSS